MLLAVNTKNNHFCVSSMFAQNLTFIDLFKLIQTLPYLPSFVITSPRPHNDRDISPSTLHTMEQPYERAGVGYGSTLLLQCEPDS